MTNLLENPTIKTTQLTPELTSELITGIYEVASRYPHRISGCGFEATDNCVRGSVGDAQAIAFIIYGTPYIVTKYDDEVKMNIYRKYDEYMETPMDESSSSNFLTLFDTHSSD